MKRLFLFAFGAVLCLCVSAQTPGPGFAGPRLIGELAESQQTSALPVEGQVKTYTKSSVTAMAFMGRLYTHTTEGAAVDIVYDDNGTVYLSNLLSEISDCAWIEGQYADGQITIECPQTAFTQPSWNGTEEVFYLKVYQLVDDQLVEAESQSYIFKEEGTGNFTAADPDLILGVALSAAEFRGESANRISLQDSATVSLPSDVEVQSLNLIQEGKKSTPAQMAVDGQDIYLAGLYPKLGDAWVKGRIDGDVVRIPSGQFLGLSPSGKWWSYFQSCNITVAKDDYGNQYNEYEILPEFTFEYDAANGILSSDGAYLINTTETAFENIPTNILTFLESPYLKIQDSGVVLPPRPADIFYASRYMDKDPDWGFDVGYGGFSFNVILLDVEGNTLDPEYLSYEVYLNGELYTFTPEYYPALESPITEIPYNFTCGYDITSRDTQKSITIYEPNETLSYGVVMIQRRDGKEARSEMALYEFQPVGVESTEVADEIIRTEYIDIAGRKIDRPVKGIYFEINIHSSGRMISRKIMK